MRPFTICSLVLVDETCVRTGGFAYFDMGKRTFVIVRAADIPADAQHYIIAEHYDVSRSSDHAFGAYHGATHSWCCETSCRHVYPERIVLLADDTGVFSRLRGAA